MFKKVICSALVLFSIVTVDAQVKTPPTSSKSKTEEVVGLTNITIDYSRPSMRGRSVFGDLVPYGRMWRTGANMNTTVTFADDVSIAGKELKKGKYALYTIPKATSWEVIFYSDTNNWGLPEKFDESKVALRTDVKSVSSDRKYETFTIALSNVDIDGVDMELIWEKTIVPIHIGVPSEKLALASIEQTFSGPKAVDYYAASQYYFLINKELSKALKWIDAAIEKEGASAPFYFTRLKSQIQAKMGDKKGAVETAKKSLEMAEKANNFDYIKMNKDAILEWSI